jgi:hypothetical protein
MLRIECTGLTLREGQQFAEYLRQASPVEVQLDLNLKGTMHTRRAQASLPHFYLFVRAASMGIGGGIALLAGKTVTEELTKDIYRAIKSWMSRFSGKSSVEVEVKLYGPDDRLIDISKQTR